MVRSNRLMSSRRFREAQRILNMNPEYPGQDLYAQSTRHWVLGLPFSSAHVAVVTDGRATEAVTQPPRAVKAELPSCLQGAGPAAPQRSAGPAGAAAAPGGAGRRPAGRETRGASGGAGGRCRVAGLLRPAGRRRPCAGESAKGARARGERATLQVVSFPGSWESLCREGRGAMATAGSPDWATGRVGRGGEAAGAADGSSPSSPVRKCTGGSGPGGGG